MKTSACGASQFAGLLASFDPNADAATEIAPSNLPKGFYVATVSELLFEKIAADGSRARLIARETIGAGGGQIVCSENMDHLARPLGGDFDMAVTVPVKFDNVSAPGGSGFALRQFYVFADKDGQGVLLSNPSAGSSDLAYFLSTGPTRGRFVKLSGRTYGLRLEREQDGARLRTLIHLDQFPQ